MKVYLKTASVALLSAFTDIEAFSVIPKDSLQEGVLKPSKYPPGTGPFKFVKWEPKRRLVYDRIDNYWGHKAFIDRLIERPVRNDTVRLTALRAGDVDMAERIPYEWVDRILGGKLKGIFATKATVGGFRQIMFNVASPPFNVKSPNQAEATTLQAQLKKIGMNIEIKSFDSGAAAALSRVGKFAFKNTGGRGMYPDPSSAYERLRCEQNPKKRTINNIGYCYKELDVLLNKAAIEVNPDKRKALFKWIVTIVNEDLPVLYLGVVPRFWGLRERVKGFASGSQYWIWWGGGVNYVWLDK